MGHLNPLLAIVFLIAIAQAQYGDSQEKTQAGGAQFRSSAAMDQSRKPQFLNGLLAKAEASQKAGDLFGLANAYVSLAIFYRGRFDWGKANAYNDQAEAFFERLKDGRKASECRSFRDGIWAEIQRRAAFQSEIEAAEKSLRAGELDRAFELASHCAASSVYEDRTAPILGSYHLSKGQLAQATAYFGRAIELQPLEGENYVKLALTKLAQKDINAAEYWIEAGRDILPETALRYCCIGQIDYARGQFLEAIANFEKAVALDQGMSKAWKCLIASYEALYNRVTAREYAQRFADKLAGQTE